MRVISLTSLPYITLIGIGDARRSSTADDRVHLLLKEPESPNDCARH